MLLDFRSIPMFGRITMSICFFVLIMFFSFSTESLSEIPLRQVFLPFLIVFLIVQSFTIAEKNRLESLYAALPLTREDIVKARYLFFVSVQVLIILPPLFIKACFFQNNERISFDIAFTFLTVSFLGAALYPLLFKKGSVNGLANLVIFVLFGCMLAFLSRLHEILLNTLFISATSLIVISAAGLILLCLSYLLSLRIYRTRDL